jgi:hypothetical protein
MSEQNEKHLVQEDDIQHCARCFKTWKRNGITMCKQCEMIEARSDYIYNRMEWDKVFRKKIRKRSAKLDKIVKSFNKDKE